MKSTVTNRIGLSVWVIASALALAACGKTEQNSTSGEKLDAAISNVEQKTDSVGKDVRQGLDAARADTADAIDKLKADTQDASITTQVTAELARDPELSALKIDVDTHAGKVVLRGTAPSDAARNRAVTLVRAVSGVVDVDNQLRVGG